MLVFLSLILLTSTTLGAAPTTGSKWPAKTEPLEINSGRSWLWAAEPRQVMVFSPYIMGPVDDLAAGVSKKCDAKEDLPSGGDKWSVQEDTAGHKSLGCGRGVFLEYQVDGFMEAFCDANNKDAKCVKASVAALLAEADKNDGKQCDIQCVGDKFDYFDWAEITATGWEQDKKLTYAQGDDETNNISYMTQLFEFQSPATKASNTGNGSSATGAWRFLFAAATRKDGVYDNEFTIPAKGILTFFGGDAHTDKLVFQTLPGTDAKKNSGDFKWMLGFHNFPWATKDGKKNAENYMCTRLTFNAHGGLRASAKATITYSDGSTAVITAAGDTKELKLEEKFMTNLKLEDTTQGTLLNVEFASDAVTGTDTDKAENLADANKSPTVKVYPIFKFVDSSDKVITKGADISKDKTTLLQGVFAVCVKKSDFAGNNNEGWVFIDPKISSGKEAVASAASSSMKGFRFFTILSIAGVFISLFNAF